MLDSDQALINEFVEAVEDEVANLCETGEGSRALTLEEAIEVVKDAWPSELKLKVVAWPWEDLVAVAEELKTALGWKRIRKQALTKARRKQLEEKILESAVDGYSRFTEAVVGNTTSEGPVAALDGQLAALENEAPQTGRGSAARPRRSAGAVAARPSSPVGQTSRAVTTLEGLTLSEFEERPKAATPAVKHLVPGLPGGSGPRHLSILASRPSLKVLASTPLRVPPYGLPQTNQLCNRESMSELRMALNADTYDKGSMPTLFPGEQVALMLQEGETLMAMLRSLRAEIHDEKGAGFYRELAGCAEVIDETAIHFAEERADRAGERPALTDYMAIGRYPWVTVAAKRLVLIPALVSKQKALFEAQLQQLIPGQRGGLSRMAASSLVKSHRLISGGGLSE